MEGSFLTKVEELARQVAERCGCLLYDIEWSGSTSGQILRVYIDKALGVSIQDCEDVSQGLNLLLDVEDFIPGKYSLEVSSPGLERQLKKPWHYVNAKGKKIWFKADRSFRELGVTTPGLLNARSAQGILTDTTEGQGIVIDLDGTEIKLDWDQIESARLVFEIQKGQKKNHKNQEKRVR